MKVIIELPDTTFGAFVNYVYRDTLGFGHDEVMSVKSFTKNELNDIRVDEDEDVETKILTKEEAKKMLDQAVKEMLTQGGDDD